MKSNFDDSRSVKLAFLTHLEALKFDFLGNFCTLWKLKFSKLTKFRDPEITKTAFLELLHSPKLISRKI